MNAPTIATITVNPAIDQTVSIPNFTVGVRCAAVLRLSFITEGVIPFAAKDPVRILPACIAGSAVTGGLSMLFDCTLRAPHGGVFVLAIPNAVGHAGLYLFAIVAGTIVTALIAAQLARLRGLRT